MQRAGLFVAFLVATFGLVGCGGGGDSSYEQPSGPPVATLRFRSGNLYFKPNKASTSAGVVKIAVKNDGGTHTFSIHEIKGFRLDVGGSGDSASGKVELQAGTKYRFYCSIPGHEAAGMKGTLTIR